jgi:hypothetical protein
VLLSVDLSLVLSVCCVICKLSGELFARLSQVLSGCGVNVYNETSSVTIDHSVRRKREVRVSDLESRSLALNADFDELRNVSCVSQKRNGLGVKLKNGSGLLGSDDVERNVHENLLALVHNNEVDVLDDLEYGVLLDILDQCELALAIDLQVEDCVLLTKKQADLVCRNCNVLYFSTVTVYDGRNLTCCTQTASKTLTELGTYLCGYLVINFSHDGLLY